MQVVKHGEIAHLKTTEEEGRGAPVWTERWALMQLDPSDAGIFPNIYKRN